MRYGASTPSSSRSRPNSNWSGASPAKPGCGRARRRPARHALTFEDRAEFDNGWSESRIRFCHFDSPTHIRVVSSDTPDGADVLIDDDGYRVVPFRMTVPLGPVPFPVRCYDSARVEDDGSLIETVDLRFGRIPLARVVMRARAVAPLSASADSRAASPAQPGAGAGA